ncbi:Guanylate kinase [Wolbachia endosymbiont of Drosophila simulans wNo]|uniref:guanylate kinase n=1 Tax=unclassified Wolbachia TaxID=2640676 RepID=UPI0002D2521B|nr:MULTISPECIES: guanylate kinase [unclassified Wolbachia]AGJ98665.1 Guanylate kinase [Wolbachia endosymbiont of Drosophila simulans wNo]QCB62861.1 guanylate kinase [Wolbachia endosymbiont of Drosophila mauritiana]QCB63906.1 guanylate kinase [Wolbachia endosymbiont of Drosophila mauritiana]QWE33834.1 Guanylate kinase [Wolbachia endosymbiont of Drosophila simulans]TGB07261.1 guanylate kinase [Wolbachia endosymbiont of Drosophila mauritiana]
MTVKNEGILLILSSPSGAGKTTISEKLLEQSTDLVMSISMTTRKPRPGEVNGKDYFFVTEEKFHELCKAGQMLEYAKVFENFYGIPKDFIEQNLSSGISVLLNIDWQGAFHLFEILREKVVSVFILPPSMEELRLRLQKRNSDDVSEIERRLSEAQKEISKSNKYDYVIVNDDLDKSVEEIKSILSKEMLKKLEEKPSLKDL